ncbi:DNA-binding transcriptional regulator, LysR family [Tranquillimonas rosea]|uniref:DNA-binding transcriptional regulator, LysR family n=1 Tax=Tranquillimonas rosea TaxID=641238 RepID=A0A1H9S634_9RHOB|nr:LysR family transcriptional regulator [Tranquillimonas rosea]SER80457.1 DNA-binding transcriptional regulator, LysR family [Tranquillimonas rosea]
MRYTLDEIETFLAVIELGTLTAAAARLNLAKSVVSKRVSDLERSLGAALFRRQAGRIAPTEAAERLAERLRPALAELSAATESAAWEMDGSISLRGVLKISAPMTFGTQYLSSMIARFAEKHADLEFRVDYDDRYHDLAQEGYDVGIRIGDLQDGAMIRRKLCDDRMMVCASPEYVDARGKPETAMDLAEHACIGYSNMSNARFWQFSERGRTLAPVARTRLTVNNGEAMRDLAVHGLGIAMLPGFIAQPAIDRGTLVPILSGWETRALPIAAVWPPIRPVPAKLRGFVDYLADELKNGAPWRVAA